MSIFQCLVRLSLVGRPILNAGGEVIVQVTVWKSSYGPAIYHYSS